MHAHGFWNNPFSEFLKLKDSSGTLSPSRNFNGFMSIRIAKNLVRILNQDRIVFLLLLNLTGFFAVRAWHSGCGGPFKKEE